MASLEILEAKIDSMAAALAHLQGQLEGKVHFSPCPEVVALIQDLQEKYVRAIKEMQDEHVRPLEDWRQRAMGMIWPALALGGAGAALGVLEAVNKWFQ